MKPKCDTIILTGIRLCIIAFVQFSEFIDSASLKRKNSDVVVVSYWFRRIQLTLLKLEEYCAKQQHIYTLNLDQVMHTQHVKAVNLSFAEA